MIYNGYQAVGVHWDRGIQQCSTTSCQVSSNIPTHSEDGVETAIALIWKAQNKNAVPREPI